MTRKLRLELSVRVRNRATPRVKLLLGAVAFWLAVSQGNAQQLAEAVFVDLNWGPSYTIRLSFDSGGYLRSIQKSAPWVVKYPESFTIEKTSATTWSLTKVSYPSIEAVNKKLTQTDRLEIRVLGEQNVVLELNGETEKFAVDIASRSLAGPRLSLKSDGALTRLNELQTSLQGKTMLSRLTVTKGLVVSELDGETLIRTSYTRQANSVQGFVEESTSKGSWGQKEPWFEVYGLPLSPTWKIQNVVNYFICSFYESQLGSRLWPLLLPPEKGVL